MRLRERDQSGATTRAAFRDMLVDVCNPILDGNDQKACRELSKVMVGIDGASSPPDLVFGVSGDVFYIRLAVVFNALNATNRRLTTAEATTHAPAIALVLC